jgi:glutathione S-transferase
MRAMSTLVVNGYGPHAQLLDALEQFVGRHPGAWWFGAQPSSADAIVHAFVTGTITRVVDSPMHDLLDDRPGLRAWFEHADVVIRAA